MSHWALAYTGQPWVAGEHDCWAFARRVWRERFGLEVPAVNALGLRASLRAFQCHPERAHWLEVPTPAEGDGVLMGKSARGGHVGVWVDADGGGVLHCVEHAGVVFSRPAALAADGWHILGYFRHA